MAFEIRASAQLQEKVRVYVSDLISKEDDWAAYFTQTLNLIEHELFLKDRTPSKEKGSICANSTWSISKTVWKSQQF